MNDATRDFVESHLNDDIRQLALKNFPADVDKLLVLKQIEARQTLAKKVPSWAANPNLLFPKHLSLEQCSSELTAKYKARLASQCHSSTFADLTGGLGIDAFFLSENFQETYYVENQLDLCLLAENNFRVLGRNIKVVNAEAKSFLDENSQNSYSLIFVDPARRDALNRKMVSLHDCSPDVAELQGKMLSVASNVLVKVSPMLDISLICNELQNIKEIHVVSVKNECKEILVLLERGFSGEIKTVGVNIKGENQKSSDVFSCFIDDEKEAIVTYTDKIGKYLYEPNSSLMKMGAFKLVSQRFKIDKLHVNSHLYTSDIIISDFPGRVFEVVGHSNYDKRIKKELLKDVRKASVVTRNFPLNANDLRKNLNLLESDEDFVFGTTVKGDKKTIVLCRRLNICR